MQAFAYEVWFKTTHLWCSVGVLYAGFMRCGVPRLEQASRKT